jgi:hypothetical protein
LVPRWSPEGGKLVAGTGSHLYRARFASG